MGKAHNEEAELEAAIRRDRGMLGSDAHTASAILEIHQHERAVNELRNTIENIKQWKGINYHKDEFHISVDALFYPGRERCGYPICADDIKIEDTATQKQILAIIRCDLEEQESYHCSCIQYLMGRSATEYDKKTKTKFMAAD